MRYLDVLLVRILLYFEGISPSDVCRLAYMPTAELSFLIVCVNICRNSYSNELCYISSETSCIENLIVTQPDSWWFTVQINYTVTLDVFVGSRLAI
jgi:hypothetical protein